MQLLYSTPTGDLQSVSDLRPVDYDHRPLRLREMIPLPRGATLAMLPDCAAAGLDAAGGLAEIPVERGWAVSALLPIGYTRTALPGYVAVPGKCTLPLFGYAAIAWHRGRVHVAAMQTDETEHWGAGGPDAAGARLRRAVNLRVEAEPENRLLAQLAKCTIEYGCNTARNVFLGKWEAALPTSSGCTARCLGCISKQEDDVPSPQQRLDFVPTVEEILAVAVPHLERAPEAMVSFGQGCEGEPTLQAPLLARAIANSPAHDRGHHQPEQPRRPHGGHRAAVPSGAGEHSRQRDLGSGRVLSRLLPAHRLHVRRRAPVAARGTGPRRLPKREPPHAAGLHRHARRSGRAHRPVPPGGRANRAVAQPQH